MINSLNKLVSTLWLILAVIVEAYVVFMIFELSEQKTSIPAKFLNMLSGLGFLTLVYILDIYLQNIHFILEDLKLLLNSLLHGNKLIVTLGKLFVLLYLTANRLKMPFDHLQANFSAIHYKEFNLKLLKKKQES